jgi:hypothetical protein
MEQERSENNYLGSISRINLNLNPLSIVEDKDSNHQKNFAEFD